VIRLIDFHLAPQTMIHAPSSSVCNISIIRRGPRRELLKFLIADAIQRDAVAIFSPLVQVVSDYFCFPSLNIFTDESPALTLWTPWGAGKYYTVGIEQSPDCGNCIFVKSERDRLYRLSHAIVILTLGICPRYF
jgi:hypothetical protein